MLGLSRERWIVVPLLLSACHTVSTVPISPNASAPLPKHSTVVLMGGERVKVEDGRTTADSLIGTESSGARFAVPRDRVAFVETRKVSVARSAGAGLGGLVVAASVAVLATLALALGSLQ